MRIFLLFRKYLAVLGVEPLQSFQKKHSTIAYLKRSMVFIVLSVFIIFSGIFIIYKAESIDEFADAFYMSATATTIFFLFLIYIWKMDSLFKFIEGFENLIEYRMENAESKPTYVKLNEYIEKWTGLFQFTVVQVTVPAIMIPNFILSFYLYFVSDLGRDAFSLPFPVWAPFDWKTPLGYLIIFAIEFSAFFLMAHFGVICTGTLVASCYIVFILCNEIKNDINALEESSNAGETPMEGVKRVKNFIKFHAATKQVAFDLNNIFALNVISYFLWGLSTMCSSLLMAQMQLEQNVSSFELIKPLFLAYWSFSSLFLICEFGQMVTDHFDKLNGAVDECDYTLFPKEVQKIWPIVMLNIQQAFVLRTFESASCSRESFKRVTNAGFSLFMVFREFR